MKSIKHQCGLFVLAVFFVIPLHAQTVNVNVIKIKSETIRRSASYIGNVKSSRAVSIASKKEGLLEKMSAIEGKRYKKNAILAVIETNADRINVAQTTLAMRSALNEIRQQEINLQNAVHTYLYNVYALEISKKNAVREKTLFDQKMSSDAILDVINKKLKTDELNVRRSSTSIQGIEPTAYVPTYQKLIDGQRKKKIPLHKIVVNDTVNYAPLRRALINFETTRRRYQTAALHLSNNYVKAPFDGTLLKINNMEPGKYIRKGEAMMEFGDISNVRVEVDINQDDLPQIKINARAQITIDPIPNQRFNGIITSLAQKGNALNRTFPIKITVKNNQYELKPGYSARVVFDFPPLTDQILVPAHAVTQRADGAFVYTVKKKTAKKKWVKMGKNIGKKIHIVSGLKNGELLVIRGQAFLKDNDPVFIVTN